MKPALSHPSPNLSITGSAQTFTFYNCIVPMGFLPWEIRAVFPGESLLQQSRATQPTVHVDVASSDSGRQQSVPSVQEDDVPVLVSSGYSGTTSSGQVNNASCVLVTVAPHS